MRCRSRDAKGSQNGSTTLAVTSSTVSRGRSRVMHKPYVRQSNSEETLRKSSHNIVRIFLYTSVRKLRGRFDKRIIASTLLLCGNVKLL